MNFDKPNYAESNNDVIKKLANKLNNHRELRKAYEIMDDEGMSYVVNPDGLVFRGEKNRDTLVLGKVVPNSFQVNDTGELSFSCTQFSTDPNTSSDKQDYVIKKVVSHDGVA